MNYIYIYIYSEAILIHYNMKSTVDKVNYLNTLYIYIYYIYIIYILYIYIIYIYFIAKFIKICVH